MEDEVVIPKEARLRYIERRKNDIDCLRSALATQTFAEFTRIGHQLKGNAASFGYKDLEKVAIELERAGQQQDSAEAAKQLNLFENWLTQVLDQVS